MREDASPSDKPQAPHSMKAQAHVPLSHTQEAPPATIFAPGKKGLAGGTSTSQVTLPELPSLGERWNEGWPLLFEQALFSFPAIRLTSGLL